MRVKYLIFGDGLLGSAFSRYSTRVPIAVLPRSLCDITNKDDINSAINYYKPDAVVNCAGIVPKNTVPISQMFKVNSFAPHYIADICHRKCKFVHISTNCVFTGERMNYTEKDTEDATDIYGMSKLFGEPSAALVIRTSFVGLPDPKGRGLLAWAQKQKNIVGYDRVLWNGVTTLALIKKIQELADQNVTGIRHVYSYTISKYYLLSIVNEMFDFGLTIDKETEITDSPHSDTKTLSSVYPNGFISIPIEQQLENLVHDT